MIEWVALPKADGETAFVNPERCRVHVNQRGRVVVHTEGDAVVLASKARRDVVLAALDGDFRAQALLDPGINGEEPRLAKTGRAYGIAAGVILLVGVAFVAAIIAVSY